MSKRNFQRGDIVVVNLNPVAGHEQQSSEQGRPALVLSTAEFNRINGVVMIAPITQGGDFARFAGFAVTLAGTGCNTQGVALVNMVRSLDLVAQGAKRIESVPDYVVADALARLTAIFE
jgi:mRNA interferase ChpB